MAQINSINPPDLSEVRNFWDEASCGEKLLLNGESTENYAEQASERYRLEPYILLFAGFAESAGERVLEIGVGLGADHEQFHRAGAIATGIDLTDRAIEHTSRRLHLQGFSADVRVANAEALPFDDATFDRVFSWGVLHHSPNTPEAISEAARVLKSGGSFRIMIYNKWSIVGMMLWVRYALLSGKVFTSLAEIYSRHMESPGTKAYTPAEARALVAPYLRDVVTKVELTHGDLLESGAGQRHQGLLLTIARKIWPRRLIKVLFSNNGTFLLISGVRK